MIVLLKQKLYQSFTRKTNKNNTSRLSQLLSTNTGIWQESG